MEGENIIKVNTKIFNSEQLDVARLENIKLDAEKRITDLVEATFGCKKVDFTFQNIIDDTANALNKLIESEVSNRIQNELTYRREKYKIFNRR